MVHYEDPPTKRRKGGTGDIAAEIRRNGYAEIDSFYEFVVKTREKKLGLRATRRTAPPKPTCSNSLID